MRRFKRIVGGLFILFVLLCGVGFYLGWLHISSSHDDANKTFIVSLEVNKAKLVGETEAVKEKAQELGHSLSGTKSAKGTIAKVDELDHRFTLTTEDSKEMVFQVPSTSKASLKDLRPGEQVTVAYKVTEEQNVAQNVTVVWSF